MSRRLLVLVLSAALCVLLAPPVRAHQSPEEVVRERATQVMQVLKERGAEFESKPEALYRLVDELILPMVDFEAMAKLTLGTHWRRATPEQRNRFVSEYRTLLVRTYTKSLLEVRDKQLIFLPNRNSPRSDYATVSSELVRGGGQSNLPVVYSLRRVGGQWKIYDLTIEGLSLVKNYRTSFGQEIDQMGLDAFLDRLARNNREKAGAS